MKEFIMKPKVDFCFKELMADEEIRRGFLSAVLDITPEKIVKTSLLPTHLRKEYDDEKLGILDVRILMNDCTQIDVEIQIEVFKMWAERSLFYLSKMFKETIREGEDYDSIKRCIHISILDFVLFEGVEEFHSRFHLWEDNRRQLYSDKFEIHVVELPKLMKHNYPNNALLSWTRFLNAEKREEFEMAASEDEFVNKAYDRLMYISADEEKRLEYEAREKAIRDHNHLMKYSRLEGFEQGCADGFKQGKEEGIKEGIEQGKEEGIKIKLKEMIAKKLAGGKAAEVIADELEEEIEVVAELIDEIRKETL